jgi:alpha-galactosidase
MTKQQKITLIGAGSLQFGLGSAGSIINSDVLKGSIICLHDINEEMLKLAYTACKSAIEQNKLDFSIESTTNRKEALKGATFVINSIEVTPRFELWDQDFTIPQKFGNRQIFGENGGPGGFFHSARIIPPILEICEDIVKICPNVLFINYSNPMSRICLAIKRKYPNLKFVGLCHEYYHHIPIVAKLLNTKVSNLEVKAGGLNHFGVILNIKFKDSGKDAYPEIRKSGVKFFENFQTIDGTRLIKYILKNYGYMPYTTDSHFGEYIHWAWDIADLEGVRRFKTTYIESLDYAFKRIKSLIQRGKGARLVKSDEEKVVPIIEGILTDNNYEEASVNLPNEGIITNLPKDLVVECSALVNKKGLTGIPLGEYPKNLAALLRTQASVQDLTVDAIINQSKKDALQALLADPVVDSQNQAEKILEEMLKVQGKFLHLK